MKLDSYDAYGLICKENHLYYSISYNGYKSAIVLQTRPEIAAWQKNEKDTSWHRTHNKQFNLMSPSFQFFQTESSLNFDHSLLQLVKFAPSDGPFDFEPVWSDTVTYDIWEAAWAWEDELFKFRATFPKQLTDQVEQFREHQWELMEAISQWPGFADLLDSNPALAFCLAVRLRVNAVPGKKRPAVSYASLVNAKQRTIAAALGFQNSEATVSILKKMLPDACTKRDIRDMATVLEDQAVQENIVHAHAISSPCLFLLRHYAGPNMGGKLIDEISEAFPRITDIVGAPAYVVSGNNEQEQLNKPGEFQDLMIVLQDIVQFYPGIVLHSMADVAAKHASMIKKLQAGRYGSALQLPAVPFPGNSAIQPLESADGIVREGKGMNHCGKSEIKDVYDGQRAIYQVLEPTRATMSLVQGKYGWYFEQLKTKDNGSADHATRQFVSQWLKENGIKSMRIKA